MRWSRARERRRILREEIAGVRGLLAEDLTWVGEELGRRIAKAGADEFWPLVASR